MPKREWANHEKGSTDFLERVFSQGLADIIRSAPGSREGLFGKTKLIYTVRNDVVILRFMCFAEDFGHIDMGREHVDFADFRVDDDGEGQPALFPSDCATWCDLPEKMFRDVIDHWPTDAAAQTAAFHPARK